MAATWTITIAVTDLAEKRVAVAGTRTDGADVRTYGLASFWHTEKETFLEFQQRIGLALWQQFQADQVERSNVAALIGDAETAIADGLNQQELI